MTPPTDKTQPKRSGLLVWGFWLSVILSVTAAPLSLFYIMLMMQASDVPFQAMLPLIFAGVAFAHTAVLSRDYNNAETAVPLMLHGAIAASGCVAVIGLFTSLVQTKDGEILFPFVVIGALISIADCESFVQRMRTR
jgi:hypothetical protein